MWAVLHVLVESYIKPVLEASPSMTQLEAISHLIIPFTVGYLMIFYLVFDVCCNGFAELTRFADREFYTDWWNSNTFDEFARKWNKPVHEFLLRHVYLESINTYKMSKNNATLLTFLFSSIVHEFFMTFTLKIFRPWLFFFSNGTNTINIYKSLSSFKEEQIWKSLLLVWNDPWTTFTLFTLCKRIFLKIIYTTTFTVIDIMK